MKFIPVGISGISQGYLQDCAPVLSFNYQMFMLLLSMPTMRRAITMRHDNDVLRYRYCDQMPAADMKSQAAFP